MSRVQPRTEHGPPKSGKLTPEQEQELAEWRLAFVLGIGRCEVCGQCDLETLCGHEIIRAGLRRFVKGNPAIVLVVGHKCHVRIDDEAWSVAKQLAYLYRSRPLDFRLSEINRWSIKRISRGEVMTIVRELDKSKEPWMQ